ncbi:conserved hypothetical protein [Neospora caninum Liverpool]|uniref:Uncharacterized protein n=1 Tax=Neospora caninum (strain Liverpool) TaxID=572307 RepID=F0VIF9_NEOCL|nr:conserved hypothetical protein [Neospora caninum Liverpool]CBZ53520.1 conserved hypothetical protein [Neospora caninum Liverpool]CEL67508.1 TPA: hypothetical protein BN1204_033080 [Neospora caninum Liverpool]|eukprot:XP_003883552.1 conserved hypothetical protein [Neospora caninum Liverpool]
MVFSPSYPPDGLAILLAPSNVILAGWNIEPPKNEDLLSSLLSVAGGFQGAAAGQAYSSANLLSSAAKPLTNAQVAEWLLRNESDVVAGESSSVGRPIEEAGLSAATSSTSTKAPAPAFPLTDEEYKQLDKGEPLLEGFPVLPLSSNALSNTEQELLPTYPPDTASETPVDSLFLQNLSAAMKNPAVAPDGSVSPVQVNDHEDTATEGNLYTDN